MRPAKLRDYVHSIIKVAAVLVNVHISEVLLVRDVYKVNDGGLVMLIELASPKSADES